MRILFFLLSLFSPEQLSANVAASPIAIENRKPGTPEWWLQNPAKNQEIEAYTLSTSINSGEVIQVAVSTASPKYRWEIFRMGWYGGIGALRILGPKGARGRKGSPCPLYLGHDPIGPYSGFEGLIARMAVSN